MDMAASIDHLKNELSERLRRFSPDKVVFVGVGNRLRGDDAIGPALIDLLKERVPHALDAGSAPENVTSTVRRLKPSAIVFLDAVHFGDFPPGFIKIVEPADVRKLGATTHNLSMDMVMDYLKESTGADVSLIGVQPERIGEGEGISPSLQRPLNELADALVDALKKD